jgi:hypothetical protein
MRASNKLLANIFFLFISYGFVFDGDLIFNFLSLFLFESKALVSGLVEIQTFFIWIKTKPLIIRININKIMTWIWIDIRMCLFGSVSTQHLGFGIIGYSCIANDSQFWDSTFANFKKNRIHWSFASNKMLRKLNNI